MYPIVISLCMSAIREIAKKLKESRRAWMELVAEAEKLGYSYDTVRRLLEEEGVSPPSRTYWGTIRKVYLWAVSRNIDLDLVSQAGISKAKLVSRLPLDSREEAERLLQLAVQMRNEDFSEYVQENAFGVKPDTESLEKSLSEPFSSIRVPMSVKHMFDQARTRVARVLGKNQFSEVLFVEFVAEVFSNAPSDLIRGFWEAIYGDGS